MLYAFYGTDTAKSGEKARALVASLQAKRPDAAYARLDADTWDASVLEGHLGGQGLFSNKYIIFLDRVGESPDARESLLGFAPAMKDSANIFVLYEGKASAETKKVLEKNADKAVVSDEPAPTGFGATAGKGEFNIFALADAVGARNGLKAWAIYRSAVDAGLEPESIIGTLFWQAKSMVSAARSSTAAEAGLSPFVFSKAKSSAKNYSPAELQKMMADLISLYHDSHRGLVDGELAVESFVSKL